MPLMLEERLEVKAQDPCFYEYFVAGADIFLTTNINNNLGLANGSPASLHSLTFATEDQLHEVETQMSNASPGDVITLDEPPLSVNIKLSADFDGKVSQTTMAKAQHAIL